MFELSMGGGPFSEEAVTLMIQRVGQEHCDPKKKPERRRWDTYSSLHFVLYGRGMLLANGEKVSLSKGDVFLLFKDEEYEYYPDPIDPWSYIWVDFHSNDAVRLMESCGLSPEKPYIHLSNLSGTMGLLKSLYESFDASKIQQVECMAYFLQLLSELMKNADRKRAAGEYSTVKQRHIRNIITYINNNFRLPLSVQDIASQNHISVSRMMVLFAELVGISPTAYLNKYRVSMACELLKNSSAPIGEVAIAVGVDDQLYFSRMFKKWKGVSPREYRTRVSREDPFAWLKEKNIDFR